MQTNNPFDVIGVSNKNNDVMVFAEILCELSRYNSDLKAILENSKLSANQNQNEEILYASNDEEIQNTFLNNVDSNHTNEFKTIQDPNDKVNVENPDGDKKSNTDNTQDVSKDNANISENNPVTAESINQVNVENPGGDEKSNTDNTQNVSKDNANISENNPVTAESINQVNVENPDGDAENTNNISKNNANISENNPVTAESISDLLKSQTAIWIDTSTLPEEPKQLVNKLVNKNGLSNQNQTNIVKTEMNSNVINNSNEKFVTLNADLFNDLIYYFIINTVAKDRGMSVLSNQNQDNQYNNVATNQVIYPNYQETSSLPVNKNTNNTYDGILQTMIENFRNKNINSAYQAYTSYRNDINENGDLKQFIANESSQQGISINFWGPFLWDVLKRASFSYSLYKAIRNNHRKDKIDAVLGLPHVLFILSLIFGWGAIASTILGLAVLASLVYKAINQYQQARPKYLLYSLLRTKTFYDIADRLDYALVPEVGNLYKFYKQNADQVSELLHNEYDTRNILMKFPQQQNQGHIPNAIGYQSLNLQ